MENGNVLHSSSQVFEQKFVVIDEEKYLTNFLEGRRENKAHQRSLPGKTIHTS